jgi:hypothetical protein
MKGLKIAVTEILSNTQNISSVRLSTQSIKKLKDDNIEKNKLYFHVISVLQSL